ncbi:MULTISPECIES: flagellar protein FliT [Pseudomonas]|uniref:flagellar protein FliT n=1 Tax=Pseudomonas TaxID=286 RepID=UPI0018AC035F|nr:flagellar protein FliT [Pseudomonas guariconensis]MBF8743512.1 flagellar protein FliT [Pseudomonas guariconensis]MBF8753477.1 flagellar protein FliT [Pseudomonas guariconensis]
MSALQRIEATRQALGEALLARDWAVIGELDLACRDAVNELLQDEVGEGGAVQEELEALLDVYRQLIEIASGERQSIVDEMTAITQAKSAAKVYHLFS